MLNFSTAKEQNKNHEHFYDLFSFQTKQSQQLEQQIQELTTKLNEFRSTNARLQSDLKASIDKICDLREIITDLEDQITAKDRLLGTLEEGMNESTTANESLQHEVDNLKSQTEIAAMYEAKIKHLEEEIKSFEPSVEQATIIERIAGHLRDIEVNIDRKTNLLESIHASDSNPNSCSSPSEDVSVRGGNAAALDGVSMSPRQLKYLARDPTFPVDQIIRITEKLQKHTKVEDAAVKRVRDLEMQIRTLHSSYLVSLRLFSCQM